MTTPRIDAHLEHIRSQYSRVDVERAEQVVAAGGLLVDTRPSELRRRDGEIPGAVVIDRNVLEWRLDASSPYRHPALGSHDTDWRESNVVLTSMFPNCVQVAPWNPRPA